jgi:hypothetical protein
MKLSEILKDWPEKKQWFYPELAGPDEFEKRLGQAKIDSANDMLTSCDREIDRDALARILSEALVHGYTDAEITERVISTMPTWLKRIEK